MGKVWTDRGNGQWKLTITSDNPDDGVAPIVVYGTKDEITDKLADAKQNGDRLIKQLRSGAPKPVMFGPVAGSGDGPKPMTAAERMTTVAELNNPATVDKAVTRVIESVVGSVDTLRQDRAEERQERNVRSAAQAATTFAEATPDWYPSDHNKNTLVGYMRRMGLNATDTNNYTQAFEELSAAGLLQARPSESDDNNAPTDQRQERTAPTPAATVRTPTRSSTGFRQSDISGQAPRPTTRLKYTREQIAKMSAAKYKELMMSDPELARSNDYYARQDAQKRRAS